MLAHVSAIPSTTTTREASGAFARRLRGIHEYGWALLLLGPNLALLAIFTFWPLLKSLELSFYRWDMLSPNRAWVGLDNYRYVFSSDASAVFTNTFVFTFFTVGGTMVLGLAVALLLNQQLRGRSIARTFLFAPYVVSGVAVAIIWLFLFDPNYGLLQRFLDVFSINSPNWFRDPNWAMPAVIVVYIWKNLGYAVVIYLAGLQSVPRELYEAARVDGAGPWTRFRHVTLPHLSPVMFFVFVTSILAGLQQFELIDVMTDGGPVNATTTLVFKLYEEAFIAYNAGRAAAYAIVLFVMMLLVTTLQMRFIERQVHYS